MSPVREKHVKSSEQRSTGVCFHSLKGIFSPTQGSSFRDPPRAVGMTSRVRQAEGSWRRDAAIVWGLQIRLGVRSDLVGVKQSIRD